MDFDFLTSATAVVIALIVAFIAGILVVLKSFRKFSLRSVVRFVSPSPTIKIETIRVHPLKACRGFEVDSWPISRFGVKYDREWMVYRVPETKPGDSTQGPRHVFQLSAHHLSLVTATLDLEDGVLRALNLSAPEMDPIRVPINADADRTVADVRMWYPGRDEAKGIDQGDEVAEWLSTYINRKKKRKLKYRLMRICDDRVGTGRQTEAKWTPNNLLGKTPVTFTDEFPYLLCSQSSLDDLNCRLKKRGRDTIPMDRFRPNIVISSSNNEPWIEDRIKDIQIYQKGGGVSGDGSSEMEKVMTWYLTKPCVRCQVPTINQATGVMDKYHEPTLTLRTFRTGKDLGFAKEKWEEVYFGKYVCHDNFEGKDIVLSTGDVLVPRFN